jgi:hypothetical protein
VNSIILTFLTLFIFGLSFCFSLCISSLVLKILEIVKMYCEHPQFCSNFFCYVHFEIFKMLSWSSFRYRITGYLPLPNNGFVVVGNYSSASAVISNPSSSERKKSVVELIFSYTLWLPLGVTFFSSLFLMTWKTIGLTPQLIAPLFADAHLQLARLLPKCYKDRPKHIMWACSFRPLCARARTCNLINLLIMRLRTSNRERVAKNLNLRNNSQQTSETIVNRYMHESLSVIAFFVS